MSVHSPMIVATYNGVALYEPLDLKSIFFMFGLLERLHGYCKCCGRLN